MSRGSSRRRRRWPTNAFVLVVVVAMFPPLCFRRGGLYRVHDVLVTRATAQIAVQAMADLFFRRVRIPVDDLFRRHDHARGAESALQAVLIPESFLHGMQLAVRV